MFSIELFHAVLLLIVITNVNSSFRKIRDGKKVEESMRFMVYLTKAEKSETKYDAWICGGAIVSPDFIVTSAACVEDVKFMYAIAGYSKYVNVMKIDDDECTKTVKKKVVLVCVPKAYSFDYNKVEKWAFIDIGLVKVESPYDFAAQTVAGCSYAPNQIDINFEVKYQAPNTDAMVLGWGHTDKWRQKTDTVDHNQENLQYSSILLMDKTECKNLYSSNITKPLQPIIDKYMICAMNEGNINDKGDIIKKSEPKADGCAGTAVRVGGVCEEPIQNIYEQLRNQRHEYPKRYLDLMRHVDPIRQEEPTRQEEPLRHEEPKKPENPIERLLKLQNPNLALQAKYSQRQGNHNKPIYDDSVTFEDIVFRRTVDNETTLFNYTRKAGICQNDHGGPLITWVGKREILIGVASVFRLAKDLTCIGPYLFTSTQCNGAFLDCVLNHSAEIKTKRRSGNFCDLPPEKKGFEIIRRTISWRNHPDGPAANELAEDLFFRPVIPLRPLG